MRALWVVVMVASGCGRVGFDVNGAHGGIGGDGGGDDDTSDGGGSGDGGGMVDAQSGGGAVPSFVQQTVEPTGTPQVMPSATFIQNVTAGNLIFVHLDTLASGAPTLTSVTDSFGDTYTLVQPGGSASYAQYFAYTIAQSSGPCTVTATLSSIANTLLEMRIKEYASVDRTTPLDGNVHCAGTATGMDAANCTINTATPNDLLLGIVVDSQVDPGSGGFVVRDTTFGDLAIEAPLAVPTSLTLFASPQASWDFIIVAFRPLP